MKLFAVELFHQRSPSQGSVALFKVINHFFTSKGKKLIKEYILILSFLNNPKA